MGRPSIKERGIIMRIDNELGKLAFFQSLHEDAKSKHNLEELEKYEEQYNGSKQLDDSSRDADYCRNITFELIESQVNSYIPPAKIDPVSYTTTNRQRAKQAERFINDLAKKLPLEELNDLDERMTYIYGGSVWLIEWDNTTCTHNTMGGASVRIIDPKQFIPQPFVYDVDEMEYCFIEYQDTHENLVRKYDVTFEEAEQTENDEDTNSDDTCTVVHCYYRDDEDRVCLYSWADNVELQDIEDYWARQEIKCESCNKIQSICKCEKPSYKESKLEYEKITEEYEFFNGLVRITPKTPVIKDGEPKFDRVEKQVMIDGTPAVEEVGGVVIPQMTDTYEPKLKDTKVPFYKPTKFPIVVRKNISESNSLFGQSDCKFIREQQQAINKTESRINEKTLKGGVAIVSEEGTKVEVNDEIFEKGIKVKNAAEAGAIKVLDLRVDTREDRARAEDMYQHSKRILGISDSFQGMPDTTAQSGVAKQTQAMQSAGRLESKRIMKNDAFAKRYEVLFQLYLAYSDEPRPFSYQDELNIMQGDEFSRYMFLEIDKMGEWYYQDEFLFRTSQAADTNKNREAMWEMTTASFSSGAFGNPMELDTLIYYWQTMAKFHYPMADEHADRFIAVKEMQQQQMQAQAQAEQEMAMRGDMPSGQAPQPQGQPIIQDQQPPREGLGANNLTQGGM